MTSAKVLGAAVSAPCGDRIRPPPAAIRWNYLLELTIVFTAYVVAGRIGLAVPFTSGNVSPVWPAAGIALAALLLVGSRVWPVILAGAFLVNYLTSISPGTALALAMGNTIGPVVGAALVRRLVRRFSSSLSRLDDVLGLILVAAPASAAISATVGVTVLFITNIDPWHRFSAAWLVWCVGDALGVLVVAPLALTLVSGKIRANPRRILELVALLTAVVITCALIFDRRVGLGIESDALAFAVLPLVLWGAVRFQIPGAAGVTLVISCIAIWETSSGFGPFVRSSALHNATMLQAFIVVISASGLTLASVIAERAQLIRQQAHREGTERGERRYWEIVNTANDGVWLLDAQMETVFVNPRMAEMLGYTAEEMSGRPLSDFSSDTAWDKLRPGRRSQSTPVHERGQTLYRKKDGSDVWANVSRTRAFAADGTLTGILEMVSDISAQTRAEGERQHAVDRIALLSNAVEQTADSVFITNSAGQIEYVNCAFERTTGYTSDEVLTHTPRILKSGQHDAAFYHQMWRQLLDGEAYRATLINRKKTGELYWANQTITPIKDTHGTITHFVAVLNDVTEARKYHEQEVRLRLARAVQQRFFPVAPRVDGFEIAAASHPAEETGGDYFDFIEAPNGDLYVAIGDVSGHGFDAALIMALARAYVRSFARLGMAVGEVLECVNRAMVGDLETNRYVTMLLVRLEVLTGSMTYASAGHIPGVLLNGSKGIACVMDSTGIPLGLFATATFATRRCDLKAEQILLLGTDGATETANANGVEFGCHGVAHYVQAHANEAAQQIADGIYSAARLFAGEEKQHDDITSVIVKITHIPVEREQTMLPFEVRDLQSVVRAAPDT
jgi:PAS domain S-box-containing protein